MLDELKTRYPSITFPLASSTTHNAGYVRNRIADINQALFEIKNNIVSFSNNENAVSLLNEIKRKWESIPSTKMSNPSHFVKLDFKAHNDKFNAHVPSSSSLNEIEDLVQHKNDLEELEVNINHAQESWLKQDAPIHYLEQKLPTYTKWLYQLTVRIQKVNAMLNRK